LRPAIIATILVVIIVIAGVSIYYVTSLQTKAPTTLTVYGALDTNDAQVLINSFQSSHPGIKVNYIQMTPPQAYQRIVNEVAAGNTTADLVLMSNPITIRLEQGGYLLSYNSSEASVYPPDLKSPSGNWTAVVLVPVVFAYNTNMLNSSTLPQTLQDLTDSKYAGKVIMLDPTLGSVATQYLVSLAPVVGNQSWTQFVTKFSSNVMQHVTPSTTTVTTDVANGQYEIGAVALLQDVLQQKAQGAPVNWFLPSDVPLLCYPISVGIIRTTHNLAASETFVDFVLSTGAQTLMGNTDYRIPARPGIQANYSLSVLAPGETVVFFPTSQVVAQSQQWSNYFRQLGY
jgi:iron(III) transport system substrate-binding protein